MIEGTIEGINQKEKMFGLLLKTDDGKEEWWNKFGTTNLTKGTRVKFETEIKPNPMNSAKPYKNIVGEIETVIGTPQQVEVQSTRDEQIRELAVKKIAAVVYMSGEFEGKTFSEVCKIVNETSVK